MKGSFVAVGIIAIALVVAACEERIDQPAITSLGTGGLGGVGGAGGVPPIATATGSTSATMPPMVPPASCTGRCCPKAPECYPLGATQSGAECMAKRNNAMQTHWQFRQTFSLSLSPPGLGNSAIADVLVHRSELLTATCGAPEATGGFIQLIDFDTAARTSRTGFAKYAASESDALSSGGLCFVAEDGYTSRPLNALYMPRDWPEGLPPPMPMPWKVAPSDAVQLDADFTLRTDRETLLGRLAATGDLAGKGGVFYFDKTRGYMHGYSPITYIVNYDDPKTLVILPIREAEITQHLNDPSNPNCAGVVLGDNAMLPDSCVGDSAHRLWGCPAGNCAPNDPAPTKIQGYFLIAEIEQVYSALGQTLCHLFGTYQNWPMPDNMSCRSNPAWNALDPVKGLPAGDWCAAKNAPAQGDCHDALQSVSFSTFQAFPIKDGTCAPL